MKSIHFLTGAAEQNNFNRYRMIRMKETQKTIKVHFVKNDIDPTGLGEPPFPPVFGAVANALHKKWENSFITNLFQKILPRKYEFDVVDLFGSEMLSGSWCLMPFYL